MKNMMFENLSRPQEIALVRIEKIRQKMLNCWDSETLFDLYCQADDIWQERFPFQANLLGDKWEITKLYNDLDKEIKKGGFVTVNLFGKSLQMACA